VYISDSDFFRFKKYLEWFGHCLECQSGWIASNSGSDSDLWAFTNYLEWFGHNSTISIGLKCVSWIFSLFQVGKMCFYNSESEKHNSLSWVSCIFLPFRVGKMEFVPAQIGSGSEFYMLKHYSVHITLSMAIISMWTHNTIGRACLHIFIIHF